MNKETGAAMKNEAGAEMTADEAKQKVLKVYPDATCVEVPRGKWEILHGDDPDNIGYANFIGGSEISEFHAWSIAASKLPTPIPTPASEPLCMKRIPETGEACQLTPGHRNRHSAPPSTEESGEPAKELLTAEEVLAEVDEYCATGGGNPVLAPILRKDYEKTGRMAHAILVSLNLEPVTMWRRKR